MTKEKYWYSHIYREKDYGFYVSKDKDSNKYYLGFKDEKGKCIEVCINFVCFNILSKEWNL